MTDEIIITAPDGSHGRIIGAGREVSTPLPPTDGPTRDLYERLIAAGIAPAPYVPPGAPSARTYKSDLWRRATDAEAEAIEVGVGAAPLRQRRIFDDAQYLDHGDELFAMLRAGFVALASAPLSPRLRPARRRAAANPSPQHRKDMSWRT
jgi:hypothetical protein